jgi:LacI family transcriptional regulator
MNEEGVVNGRRKRRPSLRDVAMRAGVSPAAVSKVIRSAYGVSPAMQQRVQAAIDELGYRPHTGARGMRAQTYTIAIGSEIPQLGNDFFTQVTTGAAGELTGTGYQLIIAPSLDSKNDQEVLNALLDRQVDGIIAISLNVDANALEQFSQYVPVVLIGRHDQSSNYDTVTNDDEVGVDLAMDHLLSLGHTRIAHLTIRVGADTPESQPPHALRKQAYERRMVTSGLHPRVVITEPSENSAYTAMLALLADQVPPTAVLAGHDTLAIGALRAMAERGLGASDVSVVGYDNIELASHPLVSLTTVDQYGVLLGETAVKLLLERIKGDRSDPRHVLLEPALIVRRSTAARASLPA